ncbi:MAG: hypothetical protein UX23_C0002G0002 [Parcubacteria group bacterium GW2011_GWB1_45_9]|nr:MAG: hypothetical protein UX23_C0002G0002 [Parcubacteria group bacterium GW2011_GWB1_45_9]
MFRAFSALQVILVFLLDVPADRTRALRRISGSILFRDVHIRPRFLSCGISMFFQRMLCMFCIGADRSDLL